jgi:hypothetical protein
VLIIPAVVPSNLIYIYNPCEDKFLGPISGAKYILDSGGQKPIIGAKFPKNGRFPIRRPASKNKPILIS